MSDKRDLQKMQETYLKAKKNGFDYTPIDESLEIINRAIEAEKRKIELSGIITDMLRVQNTYEKALEEIIKQSNEGSNLILWNIAINALKGSDKVEL